MRQLLCAVEAGPRRREPALMPKLPTPHWICQTCKKPIANGDGFLEIINIDPAVGTVGDYPIEPSYDGDEGWSKANPHDPPPTTEQLFGRQRIGFYVHHDGDCTIYPEREGYWAETVEVSTPERFMAHVAHLFEKSWMSRGDLLRLLRFWWSHKGEKLPHES